MANNEANDVPAILDGRFFTVHSVSGEKVVAKCNKCNPAKPISGSYAATSNFLLHLKRVHPSLIHEFENYRELQCYHHQHLLNACLALVALFAVQNATNCRTTCLKHFCCSKPMRTLTNCVL